MIIVTVLRDKLVHSETIRVKSIRPDQIGLMKRTGFWIKTVSAQSTTGSGNPTDL